MRFLCSLLAFSLSHSVEYKNHSVGYIFHSVGYKSRTVKQRIHQDKKEYASGSFLFMYRRKQIIFSGFFSPLPAHLPQGNRREYPGSPHCLPQ